MKGPDEWIGYMIESSCTRGDGSLAGVILLMCFLSVMATIIGTTVIACKVIEHWL